MFLIDSFLIKPDKKKEISSDDRISCEGRIIPLENRISIRCMIYLFIDIITFNKEFTLRPTTDTIRILSSFV